MFGIKIMKKADYEKMKIEYEQYNDAICVNEEMAKTIDKLTQTINAQNTECRVGAWCEGCKHKKYAYKAGDYNYYCDKHLHELCPEWEK